MTEVLALVEYGKVCAGLVLWDDRVIQTAPILAKLRGKTRDQVREYCRERGWRVSVVYSMDRSRPLSKPNGQ